MSRRRKFTEKEKKRYMKYMADVAPYVGIRSEGTK